jgi:hypothetical protein
LPVEAWQRTGVLTEDFATRVGIPEHTRYARYGKGAKAYALWQPARAATIL